MGGQGTGGTQGQGRDTGMGLRRGHFCVCLYVVQTGLELPAILLTQPLESGITGVSLLGHC